MKIIACVSKDMGIAFNNRRQSRDAVLCEDVLKLSDGSTLRMHPKSEILFPEAKNLAVSEDYLAEAEKDDYCFYEGYGDICWDNVDSVILYHWNRAYPSDTFFKLPKGFTLTEQTKFSGKSHPEITREVWQK